MVDQLVDQKVGLRAGLWVDGLADLLVAAWVAPRADMSAVQRVAYLVDSWVGLLVVQKADTTASQRAVLKVDRWVVWTADHWVDYLASSLAD